MFKDNFSGNKVPVINHKSVGYHAPKPWESLIGSGSQIDTNPAVGTSHYEKKNENVIITAHLNLNRLLEVRILQ